MNPKGYSVLFFRCDVPYLDYTIGLDEILMSAGGKSEAADNGRQQRKIRIKHDKHPSVQETI